MFGVPWSPGFVLGYLQEVVLEIVQVTMNYDLCDAM